MTGWVRVRAPVRVLDAGGWTDTWFAGSGTVCNLAVDDGVEVVARWSEPSHPGRLGRLGHPAGIGRPGRLGRPGGIGTVDLRVPAFGDRYRFALDQPPGRHPLVEAAIRRWAAPWCALEITVASSAPPGSSLGTSASVLVALIAALQALGGGTLDRAALARAAHRIETADLGLQCGVQDQIAAAHGGCNLITIGPYPQAEVRALDLEPATWDALARRIVTVYLGTHRSSTVHEAVIVHLTEANGEALLAPLRAAAADAASALAAGNIDAYGEAMIANTEAQAALHPALVNPAAREVIEVARRHGAAGWKVNGAGGAGGTVTIVGPADPGELASVLGSLPGLSLVPLRPARQGVRIVDQA